MSSKENDKLAQDVKRLLCASTGDTVTYEEGKRIHTARFIGRDPLIRKIVNQLEQEGATQATLDGLDLLSKLLERSQQEYTPTHKERDSGTYTTLERVHFGGVQDARNMVLAAKQKVDQKNEIAQARYAANMGILLDRFLVNLSDGVTLRNDSDTNLDTPKAPFEQLGDCQALSAKIREQLPNREKLDEIAEHLADLHHIIETHPYDVSNYAKITLEDMQRKTLDALTPSQDEPEKKSLLRRFGLPLGAAATIAAGFFTTCSDKKEHDAPQPTPKAENVPTEDAAAAKDVPEAAISPNRISK